MSDILSAIAAGRVNDIERLLDNDLDPDTIVDSVPILYWAAVYNKENIVRLLLDRGADPNIQTGDSSTPIFAADDPNIMDMLIRYGAEVNHKDIKGETMLSYLARSTEHDAIPLIKLLVARGADVNTKDNEGKTPLIKAVHSQENERVKLFLKLGADPNIKDNYGNKASYYIDAQPEKIILQMSEKRFSKKFFPSKPGKITAHWMEICNTLGNVGVYDLKKLLADNVDKHNFGLVSQFFTTSSFEEVDEFLDYIQSLNKREICAGLAKYYTVVKPEFLTAEYVRGNVRPISEMARKSIQSKRKKASLYSLAYRKARQADPEKFREHVSRLDLPNP
jgi:ankyrin repeat protein